MRKVIAILWVFVVLFCMTIIAEAEDEVSIDYSNFPSSSFRTFITVFFDKDKNGSLSHQEISAIEHLSDADYPQYTIGSLDGIELFVNLKSIGPMRGYYIEYQIDVTKLNKLEYLSIAGKGINTIDVSKNIELKYLDVERNDLNSIDISNNKKLEDLYITGNKNLSFVDVRNNTSIRSLFCSDCNIEELDIRNNTNIGTLYCENNKMKSLLLPSCDSIVSLHCRGNNIERLDLCQYTNLYDLQCDPSVVLTVYSDSYALNYAKENKMTYIIKERPFTGFKIVNGIPILLINDSIAAEATGLINDPAKPTDWYYCVEGAALTNVTSLVQYDGEWFYVINGKLDTTYAGIVNYDGGRFFVAAGRILREQTGLIMDPAGSGWYYCSAGQIHTGYTGLALYDGAWFYVINGKLDESFTGEVEYDGAKFQVLNGMLVS